MKKKIFCQLLKKEGSKQKYQIYPGTLGKRIFNEISEEGWSLWMNKQIILINENKLNMLNMQDRKLLEKYMISFLFQ